MVHIIMNLHHFIITHPNLDMLNQLGASTSKLRSDNAKFNGVLEHKFAQCVTNAIFQYIELFLKDFRKYLKEPTVTYVMANNIQQIREQLQDLYITMGQVTSHLNMILGNF